MRSRSTGEALRVDVGPSRNVAPYGEAVIYLRPQTNVRLVCGGQNDVVIFLN